MCVASGKRAKNASLRTVRRPDRVAEPRAGRGFHGNGAVLDREEQLERLGAAHPQVARPARDRVERHFREVDARAAESVKRGQPVAFGDEELPAVRAEVGEGDVLVRGPRGPRRRSPSAASGTLLGRESPAARPRPATAMLCPSAAGPGPDRLQTLVARLPSVRRIEVLDPDTRPTNGRLAWQHLDDGITRRDRPAAVWGGMSGPRVC